MSGNKWAVVGVAASVVGVAAIGGAAMAYFLMKEEEDFRKNTLGTQLHVSSRPATIEIQIPQDQAGIVIGRGGRTIKEIQAQTDTKIHFKDEKATNENRYLAITGQPEDVKLAEIMIYQTMANQPFQETFEMNVPSIYVGAIIGRNGDTVRSIEDRSGCRINVQRLPPAEVTDRRVTFRGSPSQIQSARSLIEDAINEERQFQDGFQSAKTLFLTSESHNPEEVEADLSLPHQTEELSPTSDDCMLEIFVSSISDPSFFYVQKSGPASVALDKLVQDMTSFYEQNEDTCKVEMDTLVKGSVVATKSSTGGSWYRARVADIILDDYDDSKVCVEVDFVDFGDFESKSLHELCEIKKQFLKLKFQAIPASLADVKPARNDEWSSEAIDDFESMTHASQWKSLLAKVVKCDVKDDRVEEPKCVTSLFLIDANAKEEDINIGEELVRRGHAISMSKQLF